MIMNEIVDIQKLSYNEKIKAIVFRFAHIYNFHKYMGKNIYDEEELKYLLTERYYNSDKYICEYEEYKTNLLKDRTYPKLYVYYKNNQIEGYVYKDRPSFCTSNMEEFSEEEQEMFEEFIRIRLKKK